VGRVVGGGSNVGSKKPEVKIVIDAMASDFREILATRSVYW
jgi:prolyl-tRNA editing enzyme YbaK/EbsC (Cys-tRNA(Pro) deacylase)